MRDRELEKERETARGRER